MVEQLKIGGLMAIPVGVATQELRILRRTAEGVETLDTLPVRFVPMTGKPKPERGAKITTSDASVTCMVSSDASRAAALVRAPRYVPRSRSCSCECVNSWRST